MKLPTSAVAAPTLAILIATASSLPPLATCAYRRHCNSRQVTAAMVSSTSTPSNRPESSRATYQPAHIYPYSADLSELKATGAYATLKRIHIVRHAEGTHNVNRQYKDLINLDARLTDKGKEQCRSLAHRLQEAPPSSELSELLEMTELVVTSPLTRCLQTAMAALPTLANNHKIPFVAQECIRETVNYACDRRRAISELESHFHDRVCFQDIEHDHDELWEKYIRRVGSPEEYDKHRESAELHMVADRARDFFSWAKRRPEREMVVCTHSAFLRAFLSWGHPGGVLWMMPQTLDNRYPKPEEEIPVVRYCGDASFEAYMRQDYENCELRSFVAAFPSGH